MGLINLRDYSQNGTTISFHMSNQYPEIVFPCESLVYTLQDQRRRNSLGGTVIMPETEPLAKRIISTYMERGILSAVFEATLSESRLVATVASQLLSLGNLIRKLWNSTPSELTMNLLAKHSQTRDWRKSVIRSLAWHPHCSKLAVATIEDTVYIYTIGASTTPILKSDLQKSITSLAWRPNGAGELAIGCQNGVLIWRVDPTSQISRPLSQAILLQSNRGKNVPVQTVCWNSNGELLLTASVSDGSLTIWNVDLQVCVPLYQFGTACAAMASFGPNGRQLIVTTTSKDFYLNAMPLDRHDPIRWVCTKGSVQSFALSQDEHHLLFVTSEVQELFYTQISYCESISCKVAYPLVNLKRRKIGDGLSVGGYPQSLAWCPRNCFLAIAFKDTSVISIFFTKLENLSMLVEPYYLVSGIGLDYPCCLQFQQNYHRVVPEEAQSLLTVGWSSGSIQYYPLY